VSKGEWNVARETIVIAIKQLLSKASSLERVKLLQEAAIMGQFSHPNVVKLYGLVTLGDPVSIIIIIAVIAAFTS
jgi:serine/threonine protein kinase